MADDWNTVTVIGNRGAGGRGGKSSSAVNAARRRGDEVSTDAKYGAGNFDCYSKIYRRRHPNAKNVFIRLLLGFFALGCRRLYSYDVIVV